MRAYSMVIRRLVRQHIRGEHPALAQGVCPGYGHDAAPLFVIGCVKGNCQGQA